jgi:hypothetical protein
VEERAVRAWALVGLSLAAAVIAALAARAVLAVPSGAGIAGAGLARQALVPADLRAERAAEAAFATAPRSGAQAVVLRRRVQLEGELSRIAGGTGRTVLRSRAATLLGLLLLADARSDPAGAKRYLQEARAALRTGVRLDPSNGAAAYDLELLLTAKDRGSRKATKGNSAPPAAGRAGAQPPGSGF